MIKAMKTCVSCKEAKDLTEFNKHSGRPDGLQNVCRECNRARSRKYYKENPDKHRKNVRVRNRIQQEKNRAWVREYKETHPCADCQKFYPFVVMDFDHLGDKKYSVSRMSGRTLRQIEEEIAKCELVCANCHRIRTYDRL